MSQNASHMDTGEWELGHSIPSVVKQHDQLLFGSNGNGPGLEKRVDKLEYNQGSVDARLKKIEGWLEKIFWTIVIGGGGALARIVWGAMDKAGR